MSTDTGTTASGEPTALARLLRLAVRPRARALVAIATMSILGAASAALVPYFLGAILDAVTRGGDLPWPLLAAATATFAASIVCSVTNYGLSQHFQIDVDTELKGLVADAVCTDPHAVSAVAAAGEIATVISGDTERIAHHPLTRIRLVSSTIAFAIVTAYLLAASVPLTLVVLVAVPAMMLIATRVAAPLEDRQEEQREQQGILGDLCADLGLGLRVLRGVGGEDAFHDRFARASRAAEHAGGQVARTQALLHASGLLLPGVLLLVVVGFGGLLALRGELAPALLVTFYAAATYLVTPIEAVVEFAAARSGGAVAARRIVEILDAPRRAAVSPGRCGGALEPRGDLVDLTTGAAAAAGRLTVVEGPSEIGRRWGALTDRDRLRLGGQGLAAVSEESLREVLRYQPLRPTIFSGTVRELLDPHGRASEADLRHALHLAGASDIVERLPAGLDEHLDAEGRTLSGGQRQRLALARSLLGDPPYLVLDDPVSALDAVTEVTVVRRVRRARAGRTTAVVSASPAVLAAADTTIAPHLLEGSTR